MAKNCAGWGLCGAGERILIPPELKWNTLLVLRLLKETLNFLPRQIVRQSLFAAKRGLDDRALLLLQCQNLFLHCATRNKFIAGYHASLADTVGAVSGLILH